MEAALHLQAPGADGGYLLEALSCAAQDATRGGGIFAFATADGIRTLLSSEGMQRLVRDGAFDLVVGLDAVTDERALDELSAAAARNATLTVRALVHEKAVLFHPKLSWFRAGESLTLVVGSGNLTVRGLRENWEAFATIALRGPAAEQAERQLANWRAEHDAMLYLPDAPAAREQARRNTGRERELKHPRRQSRRTAADDAIPAAARVLVAETPRSGGRPSQVNFDKHHYESFFGARAGSGRHVILRAVASDGTVGAEEVRPSSRRRSSNFSFELAAWHGLAPPTGPPVIGLYVRLPQGTFLYQRVPPGAPGHDELAAVLAARWRGPERAMRRVTASVAEVHAAWPGSPLWTATVPSS